MKKCLLIIGLIAIGITPAIAEVKVNMPDAVPIYNAPRNYKNSSNTSSSSSNNGSPSVASLARQLAKEMHYNNSNAPELQIKMQQNGVEGMEVIGRLPCPQTGKIVPIKVGNKTYTGRKKCTVIRYLYKGKEYSEGVCE